MQNKLKEYGLNNTELSQLFEYKSVTAFSSSTARKRIKRAVEKIIMRVEKRVNEKWKSDLRDLSD